MVGASAAGSLVQGTAVASDCMPVGHAAADHKGAADRRIDPEGSLVGPAVRVARCLSSASPLDLCLLPPKYA